MEDGGSLPVGCLEPCFKVDKLGHLWPLMARLEMLPQPMLPSPGSCLLLAGAKEMICKCVC